MRDCLLGSAPGSRHEDAPVAPGLGSRPLASVLADLVVWRVQHPVEDSRVARGVLLFAGHGYRTPWFDTHAWAAGLLDEALLERYFLAFLALDWSRQERVRPRLSAPIVKSFNPDLAVLQGFVSGEVFLPGVPVDAPGGRLGMSPDWPLRLRAGQGDRVCREAARLLSRHRVRTFLGSRPDLAAVTVERGPARSVTRSEGIAILAALCAPASIGPLQAMSAIQRNSNPLPVHLEGGNLS